MGSGVDDGSAAREGAAVGVDPSDAIPHPATVMTIEMTVAIRRGQDIMRKTPEGRRCVAVG